MLSNTLYRVPRNTGLQPLQKRGEGGATEMTSWRLYLEAGGQGRYLNDAEETILVVQQGSGTVSAAGLNSRVSRSGVFTEPATAVYLPAGVELTVTADDTFEAVLVSTPAVATGDSPALVTPAEVVVNKRGRGTYTR